MNIERLNQIEEIYHMVSAVSDAERAAFFIKHCITDIDLRREVESLISFENTSENFLNVLPESLLIRVFAEQTIRPI